MPKPISAGSLSLIDLKSELVRKQAVLKSQRCTSDNSSDFANQLFTKNPSRKPFLFDEKARLARDEKRTERRKKIDTLENELKLEENELHMTKDRLVQKAKLYEACRAGNSVDAEATDSCLVDFGRKRLEEAERRSKGSTQPSDNHLPESETTDVSINSATDPTPTEKYPENNGADLLAYYADGSSATPSCSKDDLLSPHQQLLEEERIKWEKEAKDEMAGAESGDGPIHYQHVLRDETWDHGVGYFKFSSDEATRQQEMERLEKLRQQTIEQREKADKLKAKRKAAMDARLSKVRERKQLKAETSDETSDVASIPLPSESHEETEEKKAKMLEEQIAAQRRAAHIRPWDEGKRKILTQEEWIEKRRKERDPEFAPLPLSGYY